MALLNIEPPGDSCCLLLTFPPAGYLPSPEGQGLYDNHVVFPTWLPFKVEGARTVTSPPHPAIPLAPRLKRRVHFASSWPSSPLVIFGWGYLPQCSKNNTVGLYRANPAPIFFLAHTDRIPQPFESPSVTQAPTPSQLTPFSTSGTRRTDSNLPPLEVRKAFFYVGF